MLLAFERSSGGEAQPPSPHNLKSGSMTSFVIAPRQLPSQKHQQASTGAVSR